MRNATNGLSVCIIARNEAERITRCLASVEGIADRVLVTDTGSNDDTVALAQAAGAEVDHFEWMDDFSAAYNHCVARAKTEWVLLLDADEELLPESRDELGRALTHDDTFAYTVLRQDLREAGRQDLYTEMIQTRVWRPRPGMAFVGRIHHQFTPPLDRVAAAEGRVCRASTIRLRHDGYTDSDPVPKLRRAERLMTMELADRPGQFYYLVELGRTRIALGDESGVGLLRQAAELVVAQDPQVDRSPGQLALLLEHLLACDVLPEGFPLSLPEVEQLSQTRFPASVPLLWQLARRRCVTGRFAEAVVFLKELVALRESNAYDRLVSFDPDLLSVRLWLNLGTCQARLGNKKEALRCFEKVAEDPHYCQAARDNAAALRRVSSGN